jgi:hypothetical protein
MFGKPKPVEGKCNAELHIADDYGDNHATMLCTLDPGHEGPHKESFIRVKDGKPKPVTITWEVDERHEYDIDEDDD